MDKTEKTELKQRIKKYVRAMEHYSTNMDGQMLKIESRRYFEDHFTAEERKYVKQHCPIFTRLKLTLMGANIF